MRADVHAVAFEVLLWIMQAAAFVAFVAMCAIVHNWLPALIVTAVFGVSWAIIWFLPVRCSTPGCSGVMKKDYEQVSCFKDRLHYQCPDCKHTYEKVFVSTFGRVQFYSGS